MDASVTGVSVRVMTYDDIASEMGLKPPSARQLVRRKGWRRVPGNDGRARVEVPVDELAREIERGVDTPVDPEPFEPVEPETPVEAPVTPPIVTALESHVARLERALEASAIALSLALSERGEAVTAAQALRDEAATARTEIAVLRVQLDAERQRAEAAQVERERWHEMARQPWWKRLIAG